MKFSIFNFQFSKLLIIILIILFLIPNFLQARLVPCGGPNQPACQICHLFEMLDRIIDFVLFYIVFPLAVLLIVIGGGMFMLSGGDPQTINNAKSILFSTIIGLVIIFSSWLLVNTFMTGIGLAEWVGGGRGWFEIPCP
jgi:hypothetical protein